MYSLQLTLTVLDYNNPNSDQIPKFKKVWSNILTSPFAHTGQRGLSVPQQFVVLPTQGDTFENFQIAPHNLLNLTLNFDQANKMTAEGISLHARTVTHIKMDDFLEIMKRNSWEQST